MEQLHCNCVAIKHLISVVITAVLITFSVFGQAPNPADSIQDKAAQAKTAFMKGEELANKGTGESMTESLEIFKEALQLYKDLDNKEKQAECLGWLGYVNIFLGKLQNALEYSTQALSLVRDLHDKQGEATVLNNIAGIYGDLGEKQKSIEYYKQAALLYHEINDQDAEAKTLNNIGTIYSNLGEHQKALEYFNQVLPFFKSNNNQTSQALTLNNIALVYQDLGEEEKALDYLNQALTLFKSVDDKRGEATTLNNIGIIYDESGEKLKSIDYYKQVITLRKAIGDPDGTAIALNNIGVAYNDLYENTKALEYFNQVLPLVKTIGDRGVEATTLSNIGRTYADLGEYQKAIEYLNQALPLLKAVGNKRGEAIAFDLLRNIWFLRGNHNFANYYGKLSVNSYQELRFKNTGLERPLGQSFLKKIESPYRSLAQQLIEQNRLAEAQQVLNTFKDQQFFDFDRTALKQPIVLAFTPHENVVASRFKQSVERISKVQLERDELKRQIGENQPKESESAQLQRIEDELKIASDEFTTLLQQAELEFAKTSDEKDKISEILDINEMQTSLQNLSEQTGQQAVAVYQLIGQDKFHLLLITPESIKKVSLPVKGEKLNEQAKQFWALLQSDRYDTTKLGRELYEIVFKPLEKELPKETKTILWSLDGNLRYVPMAALFDGRKFLTERFNHVIFTRADKERMTRAVQRNWTGTAFGSSKAHTVELLGDKIPFNPLPGVNEEIRLLFKQKDKSDGIFEGEFFNEEHFTKAAMLDALKQRRPLVHIASHFSFRPGDEARSFLLLGDGSAFTLSEMKKHEKLFEGVELLTLSACNTAAQRADANGREVDAFAELAQRLGASAVMATLWAVADNSTPWLMREFYQTRQNKNPSKAEALRQAQLSLLKGTAEIKPLPMAEKGAATIEIVITADDSQLTRDKVRAEIVYVSKRNAPLYKKNKKKPFAHPYFWSPFVLIGNWR